MSRAKRIASGGASTAAVFALLALAARSADPSAPHAVIVKKPGGAMAPVADALAKALPAGEAPKVVELTGDALSDGARIARETQGLAVLFAVGPDATEAAGEARGTAVVSLGVANPARVKTPGTYVSIYPRMSRVFEFLKTRLKATKVGLVFSPDRNREIALSFLKAAEGTGVTVIPVPVSSSGDLVRELKQALPGVDALVLPVDPLLFEAESLDYIVGESRKAGKPTIGFLEDLPRLGVTVGMVASPAAAAAAAVAASHEPVTMGKKRVEVETATIIVSRRAAEALKLNPEALGADRLE